MAQRRRKPSLQGPGRKVSSYINKNGEKIEKIAWGPDADRFNNDPAFASQKNHQIEFKGLAPVCKLIRTAFIGFVGEAADNRVTSRITSLLHEIKNLHNKPRGQRTVAGAITTPESRSLFLNFNFNLHTALGDIIRPQPSIDLNKLQVQIKKLQPSRDLKTPKGATHLSLSLCHGLIDLKTVKAFSFESEPLLISLGKSQKDVILPIAPANRVKGLHLLVLKAGFVQEQGGNYYPLNDRQFNAATVLAAW